MKLQKQTVYLPIEVEHDDECFFITDSEQDYLGAIKKEEKFVLSDEELTKIIDGSICFALSKEHLQKRLGFVNPKDWEVWAKTQKEAYINNLLKQK